MTAYSLLPSRATRRERPDVPGHRFVAETRTRATKTATLVFNPTTPTETEIGGDAGILQNGNVEYCASAGGLDMILATDEVTLDSAHGSLEGKLPGNTFTEASEYRVHPGVQW